MADKPDADEAAPARHFEHLALLTVAIVLGAVGFAFHVLWFAAIVVMALLWGFIASTLRGARATGGIVSAVVVGAVSEARELAADVTGHAADRSPVGREDGRPDEEPAPEESTKQELYDQAREAGIQGRSTMSKDDLREALEKQ